MKNEIVNKSSEDIRCNLEKIISITYPLAEGGDIVMSRINNLADECIKFIDSLENK